MTIDGSEHYLAITPPPRDDPRYAPLRALLEITGFTLDPRTRKWWLRDRHKTLNFLANHLETLLRQAAALTPNFQKNTAQIQLAQIQTTLTEDTPSEGGMRSPSAPTNTPKNHHASATQNPSANTPAPSDFPSPRSTLHSSSTPATHYSLLLTLTHTTPETLRTALASNRSYLETDGKITLISPETLAQFTATQRALADNPRAHITPRATYKIPRNRIPEIHEILQHQNPNYQAPETWTRQAAALANLTTLPPAPIPEQLAKTLRPYQRIGAAWLHHLHKQKLGGILADEMGLGKTLQTIAHLAAIPDVRALVVCPATLIENWRRETARFAPQLRTCIHHADKRLPNPEAAAPHNLIITSYGTLTRDQHLFQQIPLDTLVADEAQHLKNRRTQNAQTLRTLRATSRILLTGTPVENTLDDLRSLAELILPGHIQTLPKNLPPDERAWHDQRLRAKTAPYILRRRKHQVAPELPAKIEQTLHIQPTPAQQKLYEHQQQQTQQHLDRLARQGAAAPQLRLAALTQLLRLRQICCDPRLVAPSAPAADSAKLETLRELLDEAIDDGHRILLFSQFTQVLDLLQTHLRENQIPHCRLDGTHTARQRQAAVDEFNTNPAIPIFLISLKAGGTGLNLTAADTVIHYDPWWNPAVEAQAADRAHRIGQTKIVTTYRLICAGTVEEKVEQLQHQKRRLLADIFDLADAQSAKLSLADLTDLLK